MTHSNLADFHASRPRYIGAAPAPEVEAGAEDDVAPVIDLAPHVENANETAQSTYEALSREFGPIPGVDL